MTKKNIAAMNEMDKVSGGMIYDPNRPYPHNLPPGSIAEAAPNPLETSAPDGTKVTVAPITELVPGGKTIELPNTPQAPDSPWPHCGNY